MVFKLEHRSGLAARGRLGYYAKRQIASDSERRQMFAGHGMCRTGIANGMIPRTVVTELQQCGMPLAVLPVRAS
jgi:hypothetical protein